MATLKPTLSLVSTDASSDTLDFTVTDTLTVTTPTKSLSKKAVAIAGGGNTTLVASSAGIKYVYVKHTGKQSDGSTSTTNRLIINFGAGTTPHLSLKAEEFAWFPVQASTEVVGISASSQTVLVEFAYYTET
tara:strand:+ start:1310 stop:1705 length:396 start_codon:yes stop_codon:yes gene_type:complete